MDSLLITCPGCGMQIPVTEAMAGEIKTRLQGELDAQYQVRLRALETKENQLKDQEQHAAQLIAEELAREKAKLTAEISAQAEAAHAAQLRSFEEQLAQITGQLRVAEQNELQLRQQQEVVEAREKGLELEVLRRIDEVKAKIKKDVDEEADLKLRERDATINSLKEQIDVMKRKAEQGSQQMQGEVAEIRIEEVLKGFFPYDQIEPVPKGVQGADVVQKVFELQNQAGTIVWESKRTKNWDGKWVDKLKSDQMNVRADIAILITTVLPKGIENFGFHEGIWVTDFACAMNLASALRQGLIEVSRTKTAAQGKNVKMEMLYDYLCGPEFRQKIVAILETFDSMKCDLDREKRAMEKLWKQREKQIERVLLTTSHMYGDMQGIAGQTLPMIEHLELEGIAEATEEE